MAALTSLTDAAARGLLGTRLDLGVTAPQVVIVSAFHDFTVRLALMANIGWERRSRFGKVEIGIFDNTTRNLTANVNYRDTALHVVNLNLNWKF